MHKAVRIFISSPGDVREERERARLVVEQLQRRYVGRLELSPVLWEDLPLQADMPFQQGIEMVLSEEQGVDIAVFILWSRLGSPLGARLSKADGSVYRSGTEREFDLMLQARQQSGGRKPAILAYVRQDDAGFKQVLSDQAVGDLETVLQQHKLVQQFIREQFQDPQTGANTRAYHTFQEPVSFATRLREHLRQQLDALLPQETRPETRWEGAPFQGLELFRVDHADIFFGREQAVCDVQLALREQAARGCAFVLILGASGSGKSSLARAGVVASFIRDNLDLEVSTWRWGVLLPGAKPDDLGLGLAEALAGALPELSEEEHSVTELGQALLQAPEVAFNLRLKGALRKAAQGKPGQSRLLLVVDQLEELFTQPGVSAEAITLFLKALEVLARSGSVWVLATLRSDFYARCQQFAVLLRLKEGKGQYDLLPPEAGELQRIISEPVRLAGLRYEQKEDTRESLDQRILNDAVKNPEALPLLEYLLRELYEHRSAEGLLTFKEYERLGGVEGALGNRAEAVFLGLPVGVQAVLPEVLNALTTVNEEEGFPVTRQRARWSDSTDTPQKQALVERFLGERLFIADKGVEGTAVVQVAHEALLRGWERAAQWARENREFLRSRKRVAQAHARWVAEQESADLLLPAGRPLAEAEALLLGHGNWLTAELKGFIQSSSAAFRRRERRRVKRLRAIAAGFAMLAVLACAGGILALKQKRNAERQAKVAQQTTKFLTGMFESIDPATAKLRDITVREVLDKAGQTIGTNFPGEPLVELPIQETMADIYWKLGRPDQALPHAEASLRLALADHGNRDHPDVALSLDDLAACLQEQGHSAEALRKEQAALAMWRRIYHSDHAEVAHSLDGLAGCLQDLGRPTEALPMRQEVLAMRQRLYQGDHPEVAISLNNTAVCLKDLGRSTEALALSEAALAMCQRLYPGDHPNVAIALSRVADCLVELGRPAEALQTNQVALAMRKRIYQRDHNDVAGSLNNVAFCLKKLGREAEALPLYQTSLEMCQRIYKGDHPVVAVSLGNLAACLDHLGRSAEALPKHEAALAMRQRVYKADHPDIATSLNNLALCLENLGRSAEALPKLQDALAIRQRFYKGDHPDVAGSLNNVALCLYHLDRSAEAVPVYEASLAMLQRIYKKDRSYLALGLGNLAACLENLGRWPEAIEKCQQAIAMWQRLAAAEPGNSSAKINIAGAQLRLGNLLGRTDLPGQAAENYSKALRIVESLLTADPANTQAAKLRLTLGAKLGLERLQVVVSKVVPESQAEKLGLQPGDILTACAGRPILSSDQLSGVFGHPDGIPVELEIQRGGRHLKFSVSAAKLGIFCEDRVAKKDPP